MFNAAAIAGIGVLATVGMAVQPVAADSLPASGCVVACTATFDTAGFHSFAIPVGITELETTVAGAAGAPAPVSITNDSSAVGGAGGVATIQLGDSYAGTTMAFGVGATGDGSYLQAPDNALLAVAGGGGGGGYAAYLDLPGQILATYPGGAGGSPAAASTADGGDGVAFGSLPANGHGGSAAAGGLGGTGTPSGSAGASTTLVVGGAVTLATGGAGGTLSVGGTAHTAGDGGSGFTGGGGGAVARDVPNGDTSIDVVAPGGGGSGFLASTLTSTEGTPNSGTGYVSFTWSYSPAIGTTATSVQRGDSVPVSIAGLPGASAFTVLFDGATVLGGTSDTGGAATGAFTVAASQAAGSFPLQLVVGGTVVASSSPITVTVSAALASTGLVIAPWIVPLALLLLGAGAALLLLTRRRRRSEKD